MTSRVIETTQKDFNMNLNMKKFQHNILQMPPNWYFLIGYVTKWHSDIRKNEWMNEQAKERKKERFS